ncbi:deoxyfructose oxidoreductase [Paenibacillus sp. J31TS4]|uniref:Gfo/Idh/MocA family protein n=1 Tax=Paenibacillus sp. J31TS4 TaxID=2807195 RepID=UPI001B04B940|nr:Gfo/Idh/MocA family oxidoreductase [Paenibacillus sp. J31TS4]GIP38235.1 deoxyfructose oxidoreductase [Paenibacillus sp. J31TS4]
MRKLCWGVLGTGKIISKAGIAIHHAENSEWHGIAGRTPENGESAALKYGLAHRYANYQELIEDPAIDAVYIALLNHLHKEWAIKALQAGKHVLLEKPFTMNEQEAREVAEAAKANGVQVMEAHSWRFQKAYPAIKAMLDDDVIGEVNVMTAHYSFVADPASTRWVKEWGGGALYDLGCYPIAWSRYFMDAEPVAVESMMKWSDTDVDARFIGSLYYPGNRVAQCCAAFDMANGSSFDLYGTKGRMSVASKVEPNSVTITAEYNGQKQKWITDRVQAYIFQVEAFADAILKEEPVPFGIEDAIQQTRITDALFQADREKTRISLI